MSRVLTCFMAVLLSIMAAGAAVADDYHYRNQLVGDRASGLGGSYVAVSDDVSGLYYNPAGIQYATGTSLSASVNAYYSQTKTYEAVIMGRDWKRTSAALLPNYFGIIQPYGKWKIGFSYAVPDSAQEDQDQTFYGLSTTVLSYAINFNNQDNTYLFGPSIAGELAKDFSVGLTLYFQQRSFQWTLNQLVEMNTGYEWTNTYYESNENGIRPILGFIWSPAEKFSVGLTASKTIVYSSSTAYQLTCSDTVIDGSGCDADIYRLDEFSSEERKYPLQLALGLAYFPSSSLIVSFDLVNHGKVTDGVFGNKESVMNASLGAEYYMNKSWAVRGGLFTNISSAPDIQEGVVSEAEEQTDMYGISGSLSNFTRNSSVTLGATVTSGSGKAQITGNTATQNVDILGWSLYLSSSYSF